MQALWLVFLLAQPGDPATASATVDRKPTTVATERDGSTKKDELSDPAVLARLAVALESEDSGAREQAFEKLSRAPKALVVPHIKTALQSNREATRLLAVKLVRRHTPRDLGRDVARVLSRDRSDLVRREACHAVLDLSPKDAVRVLRDAMLDDESLIVRRAAINDLGRMKSIEAAEALVEGYSWISQEIDSDYLVGHVTNALTMATGKSFGRNLEGWQFFVADLRRMADSGDDGSDAETEGEDAEVDESEAAEGTSVPAASKVASAKPSSGGD